MSQFLSKVFISLLAIDEAHCFVQWQKFRPDYHALIKMKKKTIKKKTPLLVFTATASPMIKEKMIVDLEMKNIFILQRSVFRSNLAIKVIEKKKELRKKEIVNFIRTKKSIPKKETSPQNILIYCFKKEDIFELEFFLKEQQIQFVTYHADLTEEERRENYHLFKKNKINIMLATIAFGMGVDKPDIRFVVHYSIPISIQKIIFNKSAERGEIINLLKIFFFMKKKKKQIEFFYLRIKSILMKV